MTLLPHEIPAQGKAAAFANDLSAGLPRIETDRLVLRAPRIEDFPVYWEVYSRPDSDLVVEDPSRTAAWLDFTQMVATWLLRGHGLWTVDLRETGETIGFALLGFEPGDHEPELGYLFRAGAAGHSYATEAARAARDHGFAKLGLPTLVSTIDPGNLRSARLAERLGARRDLAAEAAHGDQILVYRYSEPEGAA
ncbi:MAG: GNAT family N-acetyltransferase [Pseudomonadota bacterium]